MTSMWAWFGHDEPNYTTMPDGRKLLEELAALSPVPVFVRTHNLLTSGDGTAALKWGSTNAYTEDAQGSPVHNWTVVDRIFDIHMELGMKPLVEIGFMPEALTRHTGTYRHSWQPGDDYGDIYTGWAHPPTSAQAAGLEAAGKLGTIATPAPVTVIDGRAVLPFRLPRQGVSLITLTWRGEGGAS